MFVEIQLQAVYADGIKNLKRRANSTTYLCVLGYPGVLLAQLESMLFASKRSRQSYGSNNSYAHLLLHLKMRIKLLVLVNQQLMLK